MVFYALTSAGPARVVLKPEPERQFPRGLADASVSENHI